MDKIHLIYKNSRNYPLPVCGHSGLFKSHTKKIEETTCKMCVYIYKGIKSKENNTDKKLWIRIKKSEKKLKKAIDILKKLIDTESCVIDNNGYCQTHAWFEQEMCPHKQALLFLKEK